MIEPYYAAWLNVRNEQMKKERLFDAIRASWKDMTFLERMAFVSFVAVFVIASSLDLVALFRPFFVSAAMASLMLFLVVTLMAMRAADSFHKRMPQRAIRRSSLFSKEFAKGLRALGLCAPEQVRLVRDEAIRILDLKKRRVANIMRYTVDLVILCLLPQESTSSSPCSNMTRLWERLFCCLFAWLLRRAPSCSSCGRCVGFSIDSPSFLRRSSVCS